MRAAGAKSTSTASGCALQRKRPIQIQLRRRSAALPIQDWFVVRLIAFAYLAMPVLASDYMFRALIIPFVILAIAAIGLNILVGYCGQISIGQAAFMAVGAYAAYNLVIGSRNLTS